MSDEILVLGHGTMPVPELEAAIQEVVDFFDEPSFNILPTPGEFINEAVLPVLLKHTEEVFAWEGEDLDWKMILLLEDESNPDSIWRDIEETEFGTVTLLNRQMLQLNRDIPPRVEPVKPEPVEPEPDENDATEVPKLLRDAAELLLQAASALEKQ